MQQEVLRRFEQEFRYSPSHMFFCPGRVNLIGEHIDYNGGQVMPCAIDKGTWLAVGQNTGKRLSFRCINFPETADLHLQGSYTKTGREWFNYPLGVIHHVLEEESAISGLDLVYAGNLPIGAGLSSSASIEIATAFALDQLFGLGYSRTELALLCKRVENEFIGVNSGIMDQFAVAKGKAGHAVLLNCDTLEHNYLPFEVGSFSLVIINSNKPRRLAESKYNERFAECGAALKLLKREMKLTHLCDVTPQDFEANKGLVGDPVLLKRTRHVVNENQRVKDASTALLQHDLRRFGQLMYASHASLKEDYEVSGKELDTIVEFASAFDGCIGARMTGAGFGGCAIALVSSELVGAFAKGLGAYYAQHTGYEAEVFGTAVVDGVQELTGDN